MNFLRRLMYGRYGGDQFGIFLLIAYMILHFVALLVPWGWFSLLPVALAVYLVFRILSRNIPKRRAENERFLALAAPVRAWWRTRKMARSDKEHKYLKCPHCRQQLRVPRGNGRIKVTCRACGASFETNS